jgi:MFS family permease
MDSPQNQPEPQAAPPIPKIDVRPHLTTISLTWVFGAFWLWTVSGAALTRFATELHTPEWGFGILSAIPFVAALAQLVGLYTQRPGVGRKTFFLWTVTLARFMWCIAATIPWVLPNHPDIWWILMALCIFTAWALNHMGSPAWMSWMADIIPHKVRGRYFATRSRIGIIIGLIATLLIGYALTYIQKIPNADPKLVLKATSIIIGFAGLMGMLDPLLFKSVPDKQSQTSQVPDGIIKTVKDSLKDKNFRKLVTFSFLFNFGIGMVGQYIWLYLLKELRVTDMQANTMLVACPMIIMAIGYAFWGKIIDRVGKKPVLIVAGFVVASGALPWVFVGHGIWPVQVPFPSFTSNLAFTWGFAWGHTLISAISIAAFCYAMLACFFWPGVEIANFNLLLNFSNANTGRKTGAAYVAVNSAAIAMGGLTAGLLAAAIAKLCHNITFSVPGTEIKFTYHATLILISTALRYIALAALVNLEEPKATPTRDAFRYISGNLYSNTLEVVMAPMRAVTQVTDFRKLSSRADLNRRLKQFRKFVRGNKDK